MGCFTFFGIVVVLWPRCLLLLIAVPKQNSGAAVCAMLRSVSLVRRAAFVDHASGSLPLVQLFTAPACSLCHRARFWLVRLGHVVPGVHVREIDISGVPHLEQEYVTRLPVIHVDGREVSAGQVDMPEIRRAVQAAMKQNLMQFAVDLFVPAPTSTFFYPLLLFSPLAAQLVTSGRLCSALWSGRCVFWCHCDNSTPSVDPSCCLSMVGCFVPLQMLVRDFRFSRRHLLPFR